MANRTQPIRVSLVFSPRPRCFETLAIEMPACATLAQALQVAAKDARFSDLPVGLSYGVWGRRVAPDHLLADGDRVEIYRPLKIDPKVARRERFKKQGAKSAGLFAQRRPGAKAGY